MTSIRPSGFCSDKWSTKGIFFFKYWWLQMAFFGCYMYIDLFVLKHIDLWSCFELFLFDLLEPGLVWSPFLVLRQTQKNNDLALWILRWQMINQKQSWTWSCFQLQLPVVKRRACFNGDVPNADTLTQSRTSQSGKLDRFLLKESQLKGGCTKHRLIILP